MGSLVAQNHSWAVVKKQEQLRKVVEGPHSDRASGVMGASSEKRRCPIVATGPCYVHGGITPFMRKKKH